MEIVDWDSVYRWALGLVVLGNSWRAVGELLTRPKGQV